MRRLASVVLTGVLLTACNGDPFSPEGVSGTYNLETVSGSPLPVTRTNDSTGTFIFTAGSIILNANGTWSISTTGTTTIEGTTTTITFGGSGGTFELVAPSTIRFTSPDGETMSGTLDGDRITIIGGGDSFVYRKNSRGPIR